MQATKFVESYFDAWNHRDPIAVADHLAANGLYCDIPENAQRTQDELITNLKGFFSRSRHRYELIGDVATGDNTIAFQYRMCPKGTLGKSTSSESFNGAEFMRLNGDTAVIITDYYDVRGTVQPAQPVTQTHRKSQHAKYAKSGLSSEQLVEYKSRLEQVMLSQHTYVRSDLTLPKLASAIDCSVNHLSQVINAGFGMSFFDYLNQFRIEHAKRLLSEVDGQSSAVLNIAFTVGFNSNSAFYAAFKKYVGQTPGQYRRSQSTEGN